MMETQIIVNKPYALLWRFPLKRKQGRDVDYRVRVMTTVSELCGLYWMYLSSVGD